MNPTTNERGTALVAALSIAMILLPVGVFVALQTRTDLVIQRNLRTEVEAFYVADAGLEHAIAEIQPGASFRQILAGPDRIVDTDDDGVFPFSGGPPANFPRAPFRYDVRVVRTTPDQIRIVSRGSGANGATSTVSALVTRSHLPFTPAALYAGGGLSEFDLGSAGFQISGLDHRVTDSPVKATGAAPPIPAISGSDGQAIARLRKHLSATAGHEVEGNKDATTFAIIAALDLLRYVTNFERDPHSVRLPSTIARDGHFGTANVPQISIVNGDLEVPGRLNGSGVLVIGGTFHVSGTVAFAGLVLAMGGVAFEPASDVTVMGSFWRAASRDERLLLRGHGGILYSSAALAGVDRAFPNVLPHAIVVNGWEEHL